MYSEILIKEKKKRKEEEEREREREIESINLLCFQAHPFILAVELA